MKIVLANAYSEHNAGDGLLVKLSLDLLAEAFPGRHLDVYLVASDPASFRDGDLPVRAFHPLRARSQVGMSIHGLSGFALPGVASQSMSAPFRRALARCDVVVSVGGGYLRQPSARGGLASVAVHGSQIRAIARSGKPWLLLPQSIGPLVGRTGHLLREALRAAHTVWVRDDRSLHDLASLPDVRRAPDMALLELAATPPVPARGHGPVAVVARALERPRSYETSMHALLALLPESVGLVQSSHSGNDDVPAHRRLGLATGTRLLDELTRPPSERPSAVVSVRLHGALQSLMAGVPAVHLGYERKAWGAYSDIGLEEWVHPAREFSPEAVARQVRELQADPDRLWAATTTRRADLLQARRQVVSSLRALA